MPDNKKKTCFVVMGFHMKTDFQSDPPRTLDLDASYRHLIKPAVEEAGLECIRADEIQHSGVIDVPMYEHLLTADVVVADLSTSNANALYELGVRHALRPFTTIVIAEDQFKYPFDVNHTTIRSYKHLGEDIGFGEVTRFKEELKTAIKEILNKKQPDSPVYTYLPDLNPPRRGEPQRVTPDSIRKPAELEEPGQDTIATIVSQVEESKKNGDFEQAKALLEALTTMKKNDPYFVQQLALATYKAELPSPREALMEAREILMKLNPSASTDPETLGLWGAIHKRLWEETSERHYLDESILGYEKGFYQKNDYYNGINLAFMLNVRAASTSGEAAVADRVVADRVRRRVIQISEKLAESTRREMEDPSFVRMDESQKSKTEEAYYWILATLEEAYYALGDMEQTEKWRQEAEAVSKQAWMRESTSEQLNKLDKILGRGKKLD